MEFYYSSSLLLCLPICFNSQRDGILHRAKRDRHDGEQFQFPTGWNSTKPRSIISFSSIAVSIPNGMEFYVRLFDEIIICEQFQFPTGWNSTLAEFVLRKVLFRFQFPTGWNSTQTNQSLGILSHSFNSQRDGILPCLYICVSLTTICFNSQRDGILQATKLEL